MSNIIARMAEPLPRVFRGAGQWLALSRKYRPLGKAIAERFGENINAKAFGHWLKEHSGDTVDAVTLRSRYDSHKKQWLYWVGEPAPATPVLELRRAVEPVVARPIPCPPLPAPVSKAAIAAAMTPPPKPPEPPRATVRFSPNVVEGPSGSMIRNAEPVDAAFNPHYTTDTPRQAPYIPKPLNVIYTPNPQPRQPGVDYGQNGTQTRRNITGVSFSPFDIF